MRHLSGADSLEHFVAEDILHHFAILVHALVCVMGTKKILALALGYAQDHRKRLDVKRHQCPLLFSSSSLTPLVFRNTGNKHIVSPDSTF